MSDAYGAGPSTAPATDPGWRFGTGAPLVVAVPNPAAGAEWQWSAPSDRLAEVQAVTATLTSSATVATRVPQLAFESAGALLMAQAVNASKQAASLAWRYVWWWGGGAAVAGVDLVYTPMPRLLLPPGAKVLATTAGLAAGDQWSAITLLARLL